MDYYQTLGVAKTATSEEINKVYRDLARQFHPDKNKDPGASARFKEISEAFEVLNDPQRRQHYDAPTFPLDVFNDLFNRRTTEIGGHIVLSIEIDLEDVLKGKVLNIPYRRRKGCATCNGQGGSLATCSICQGRGWVSWDSGMIAFQRPCSKCNGTGKTITVACQHCKGSGSKDAEEEKIEVRIPAGVPHGGQISLKGLGHCGRQGGQNGNLIIVVKVRDHSTFQRLNQEDLLVRVPVSYSQLVLGDEIQLASLDHKLLKVQIPPTTQTGTKFRLQKQGLPKTVALAEQLSPEDYGNLYVQVELEVPKPINEDFVHLVEQLVKFDAHRTSYPRRQAFDQFLEYYL